MLEVKKDWLYHNDNKVQKVDCSVSKTTEGENICDFIIFHYTASTTAKSAHNNFQKPDVNTSWHITIDRDGNLYQLYDFRKITWHAGKSFWKRSNGKEYHNLNRWSIGIELVNAGPLSYENAIYKTWYGQAVPFEHIYFDANGNPWQSYTQAQLQAATSVSLTLAKQYKCVDILTHEMISPGRKRDTGPAFLNTYNFIRKTHLTRRQF